jgi:translation elongation factor EF-1alpha
MCSCWPYLVKEWDLLVADNLSNTTSILFQNSAKIISEVYIGGTKAGGGTHIISGFNLALEEMTNSNETDFTIIFISDGDDNSMSTISQRIKEMSTPKGKNINLICVGVKSGFPTFVAMQLREKLHNGLSSIPAVFLVSDYQTEFLTHLSYIKNNLISKLELCHIQPKVKNFPWQSEGYNMVYESSNYVSTSPSVEINGIQIVNKPANKLDKSEIEEIFRSWTQELQLKSIKGSVRKEAGDAVKLMEEIYKIYEENYLSIPDNKILTVLERIQLREKKSGNHLIQSLIAECKRMRDGVSLKDLSAEEAAKRLAIGTQQGKFHNKALKMRGLDPSEFENFKKEFIEKLKATKLSSETSQEASFILLQTQKEIFMEETLPLAIEKLNCYELVETFPLVGHSIFIKRTDQSMINPYTIQVISIPKINKVCDTLSLVTQGNEMEISIGNDQGEKINAVIPLFDKTDKDLSPLIRTKLYHLLMTFNVMRNVDTFYYEAYHGLLANVFLRLLKYPDSEWRSKMIDLVGNTTEMVYNWNKNMENSMQLLIDDPRDAFVTESKKTKHVCEDITKMLLHMLVLKNKGKLNEEQLKERTYYMLNEFVGRNISEGVEYFEPNLGNNQQSEESINEIQQKLDQIEANIIQNREYNNFESVNDLKLHLNKIFDEIYQQRKMLERTPVRIIRDNFDKPHFRINFSVFKEIFNFFCSNLNEEFDEKKLLIALNHGLINRDSNSRSTNPIEEDYDKILLQRTLEYYSKLEKNKKDEMYRKFENNIVEVYLGGISSSIKLLKSYKLSTDLLKIKASYDPVKPFVNVLVFGPSQSGKSSLIGRLMKQNNCLDPEIYDYYNKIYKTFYTNKNNEAYEWISNTSALDRSVDRTINVKESILNLPNKLVVLFDTPGKLKYFKKTYKASSLVDHFLLCLEASVEKFEEEVQMIKNTLPVLINNNIQTLIIALTKSELYENENLPVTKDKILNSLTQILDELKSKIIIEIITISAFSGLNIDNLSNNLENLNKKNYAVANSTKLLVLDTIDDKFDGKVIIVKSFGKEYDSINNKFISYPSLQMGSILSRQVNYTNFNEKILPKTVHSIKLDKSSKSLGIRGGSILHIDQTDIPILKDGTTARIKELSINVKVLNEKYCVKSHTFIKLEYKFYIHHFEIIKIIDKEGSEIKDIKNKTGENIKFVLTPLNNCYFENLWQGQENDTSVIIRSQDHSIQAIGEILKITYNYN